MKELRCFLAGVHTSRLESSFPQVHGKMSGSSAGVNRKRVILTIATKLLNALKRGNWLLIFHEKSNSA